MLMLRNGNVTCLYRLYVSSAYAELACHMSHVIVLLYRYSLLNFTNLDFNCQLIFFRNERTCVALSTSSVAGHILSSVSSSSKFLKQGFHARHKTADYCNLENKLVAPNNKSFNNFKVPWETLDIESTESGVLRLEPEHVIWTFFSQIIIGVTPRSS